MFIANWCIYIYTYTLSVILNELMWGSISMIWKTLLMLISLVTACYDQRERRNDKNVVKTRENYSFWNHYWYVVHKNNVKNIDLVTKFVKNFSTAYVFSLDWHTITLFILNKYLHAIIISRYGQTEMQTKLRGSVSCTACC